jgi:hypothetical protein
MLTYNCRIPGLNCAEVLGFYIKGRNPRIEWKENK